MPDSRPPLESAVASYDRSRAREHIEQGERERKEVLARFPLDAWPTLPLERYALGQEDSEDTFCRWMEFRTQHIGSMRGGSARKLIIYKHKDKPGWYFDPQYKDEREAWEQVRGAFVQAFEKAKNNDWESIDDLTPLSGGPVLRLKTLRLYFPDQVFPIYSQHHLRHFLDLLGRPEASDKSLEVVRLNRALLDAVRSRNEFSGWSIPEIERFLYHWADPRDARRVFKIAPGDNARFWDDCLRESYICVGWDEIGDLNEFESKESFAAAFERTFGSHYNGHKPTLTKKANELWTLAELEPGDLVVPNKGTSHVLAVGEVIEPGYNWEPARPEYKHTVRVKWDTQYARAISPQKKWALVTIAPVSSALFKVITGKMPDPGPHPSPEPLHRDIEDALERKRQVILYGPPGTGKTYHARRFAVAWLLQREGTGDGADVLVDSTKFAEAERRLTSGDPIGVLTRITFHPSYSYEDFIEGFRPHEETGNGSLSLRLTDGVFKRVCQAALARPDRRFLVLIDEINRANVARVFGELITLLEADKRGLVLTLPQSRQPFCIPPNVYLLGTMNTADRSIKLLDAALRRRFAFVELMPDVEILRGAKVGALALDDFLEELNRRIAKTEGREKQIGHSFLLDAGEPVTEPEEFARRFRQEILPLLQEYCYEDYAALASYIGSGLVDKDAQMLIHERLANPDSLLTTLEQEFGRAGQEAT